MSLKFFKKIFLIVPANLSTGGPEAMHQLANVLKYDLNKEIKIYYIPNNYQNPVHKNYEKYKIDFTDKIEDSAENLLIIPEYFTYLSEALKFNNIKKAIWWLSIDNYFGSRFHFINNKFLRSFYKIPYNFINYFNKITKFYFGIFTLEDYLKFLYNLKKLKNFKEIKQAHFHLVQSKYAFEFINKKLLNVNYLSDFISPNLTFNQKNSKKNKQNIICYNPKKSSEFMKYFIKNTNYKFIPLINMNYKEIINTLTKSKVYIDLGSHPGKDRLPREAAILGNCVITNKKGSAANMEDVSIPEEFKFEENYFNLKNIIKKIEIIFHNYENEICKFNNYIKKISKEKEIFKNEINNLFQ